MIYKLVIISKLEIIWLSRKSSVGSIDSIDSISRVIELYITL